MPPGSDYNSHWNDKFSSRGWGRYPPEDLVRFMGRNYRDSDHARVSVLEVGCGPGANIWYLHREGYRVAGIDGSKAAIDTARRRVVTENAGLNANDPELQVGNFQSLPWEGACFDVVIDIFAIYANTVDVIEQTLSEIHRVLKPNGRFYSKLWGTATTGFGRGTELERHTFDQIPIGPCHDMGVAHFFDEAEIKLRFSRFRIDAIDTIRRTDSATRSEIEEIVCQCTKADGL